MRISALSPCPHFNPRSPRGERHLRAERAEHTSKISIHAPRVGSDSHRAFQIPCPGHFNPRSPRGERLAVVAGLLDVIVFQSTLPAWGATTDVLTITAKDGISIHAPRVGSDALHVGRRDAHRDFNPRSPRGERRLAYRGRGSSGNFNPRSPRGERHSPTRALSCERQISIHAPRVGSDSARACPTRRTRYFNPRSPRGERPWLMTGKGINGIFQSTLPAWGATSSRDSHLPSCSGFQSTLPAWGATADPHRRLGSRMISIHAPRVGSDVSLSS